MVVTALSHRILPGNAPYRIEPKRINHIGLYCIPAPGIGVWRISWNSAEILTDKKNAAAACIQSAWRLHDYTLRNLEPLEMGSWLKAIHWRYLHHRMLHSQRQWRLARRASSSGKSITRPRPSEGGARTPQSQSLTAREKGEWLESDRRLLPW